MLTNLPRAALLACALATSLSAQDPNALHLRFGSFDPLENVPAIPAHLQSSSDSRLWLVQFDGTPTPAGRSAIVENGGQLLKYMPSNAFVVRMDQLTRNLVERQESVRWVGSYHPAFRIDPALIADARFTGESATRYNVIVADKKNDKRLLAEKVTQIGGRVANDHFGSVLFTVDLTGPQLQQFLGFDEVLWVDLWSEIELDVDNARVQGGANYVETQAGYTGAGINVHIYEGIDASHPGVHRPRRGGPQHDSVLRSRHQHRGHRLRERKRAPVPRIRA